MTTTTNTHPDQHGPLRRMQAIVASVYTLRLIVALAILLTLGLSACRDRIQTQINPTPSQDSIVVKPIALNLFANQQVRFSLADSLNLRGSFSQGIHNNDLGQFKVDSVNGQPTNYFVFVPVKDTVGTGSVVYTICKGNVCLSSFISIQIRRMSICTIAARPDTLVVIDQAPDSVNLSINDDTCARGIYQLVQPAQFGIASITPSGKLVYAPTHGQPNTPEVLTYQLSSPQQVSVVTTVQISRKPSCVLLARPDVYTMNINASSRAFDILDNDEVCTTGQIVIDQRPTRGTLILLGREVIYRPQITANPTTDFFTYHLERAGYRSNITRVEIRFASLCLSRLVPTIWNVQSYQRSDTISIDYLLQRANPLAYRCRSSDVSIVRVRQNFGPHQVTVNALTGLFTIDTRGVQSLPLLVDYRLTDSTTGLFQISTLTLNIVPTVCQNITLPDLTITDSVPTSGGTVRQIRIDLENKIIDFARANQCNPRIANRPFIWANHQNNAIGFTAGNNQGSLPEFTLLPPAPRRYATPQNLPITYTFTLVDANDRPIGQFTGRIFLRFI